MAEASIFELGKLTDVWVPVGKDPNSGNSRFRRANFDLLTWAPDSSSPPTTYIVTRGTERYNSAEIVLKDTWQVGQEFGYYGGDSLIIDPCTGDGQQDTVQSLHTFGFV